jgi:hypothetical protein
MTEIIATGLGIQIQQRPNQGTYEYGVIHDGTFIPLVSRENGLVNDAIAAQKARDAEAAKPSE